MGWSPLLIPLVCVSFINVGWGFYQNLNFSFLWQIFQYYLLGLKVCQLRFTSLPLCSITFHKCSDCEIYWYIYLGPCFVLTMRISIIIIFLKKKIGPTILKYFLVYGSQITKMSRRESNSGAVVVPLMILFRGFKVSQVLIGGREREREREGGKNKVRSSCF